MIRLLLGLFVVLLSGCTMPSHLTQAQSQDVHIRIDAQFNPDRCEYKGEVTGSEGHWYNYIFMTNDAMHNDEISAQALCIIKNRRVGFALSNMHLVHNIFSNMLIGESF